MSDLPIYIDPQYLAPRFNYDFRNERDDGKDYWRGKYDGQPLQYHRPCGWYRHAINVSGKYGSDSWLGNDGIRTDSTYGEWPNAYHGTKGENVASIVKEGFRPGGGDYGPGVYTSPNLAHVESRYAEEYKRSGKVYKIILQVKVNPAKDRLVIHKNAHGWGADYWVSTRHNPSQGIYDVRPYGILVKEM